MSKCNRGFGFSLNGNHDSFSATRLRCCGSHRVMIVGVFVMHSFYEWSKPVSTHLNSGTVSEAFKRWLILVHLLDFDFSKTSEVVDQPLLIEQ